MVHAEATVAHAVLSGMQYYHQDWAHAAAHVIAPPLRLDPNTPSYLMGLLGKYVIIRTLIFYSPADVKQCLKHNTDATFNHKLYVKDELRFKVVLHILFPVTP